ncbi:KAP family P-loop NTPase fold protein [Microbacterium dextranolyticum]|uniref:KAP NTPase domain-containing protein n=1 Tax=Microbacterium dextranolyticum TaxID=36806 RepID=A0A9W6M705_9MICO|nr:P-loop NTPase fold protein [Microbacterium dextranolyticum]MBM7463717.1 hypothetical protein [Microbacterium dextranolyticum]GLJ96452.1 hypothetical protein GCM10017591_25150 [Microbacterium dextranolyticum]
MTSVPHTGQGLSDRPAPEDHLGLEPYIQGLSEFIRNCTTPLTLAIQGDWGSGKTNTMLLIEQALEPTARLSAVRSDAQRAELVSHLAASEHAPLFTISFNTWQYSQFNLDGQLAVMMLQALVAELEKTVPGPGARERWARVLTESATYAKTLTNALANVASNMTMGVSVGQIFSADPSAGDAGAGSVVDLLATLRDSLASLVSAAVTHPSGAGDPGRIVIFIDDLDRLEPRRAVELMETLKIFLDLEHCVFVLAIDFDVVAQGVSDKYGSDGIDARKARSFFDKIIQVPFHMPVANYRIDELLAASCDKAGIELTHTQRDHFRDLIRSSVGNNPRSIKRLMNTLMLLRGILGTQTSVDRLFAVLCLQLAFPPVFTDLSSDAFGEALGAVFSDVGGIDALASVLADLGMDDAAAADLMQRWGLGTIADQRSMKQFSASVRDVFLTEDREFDSASFLRTLSQSAITGTRSESSDDRAGSRGWGHKFYLPEERSTQWQERFAAESRLRATYDLAEDLIERLSAIELPGGRAVAVGMQAGNNRHWTVECEGRRIGLLEVHQKFFHVYFGPRAWMHWHGEPVTDDDNGLNEFCRKSIANQRTVDEVAASWEELLTRRLDLAATFGDDHR